MAVRLTFHARQKMLERGTTEDEVVESVQSASWEQADLGRLQCFMDFSFDALWYGHHYQTKQVNPIFVEEGTDIVIVTVYVYYF